MTPRDYAAMSWHQRQRLNTRLRAETRQLQERLTTLRAKTGQPPTDVAADLADARAQLAALPPDPKAAEHRAALWHELHTRKTTP